MKFSKDFLFGTLYLVSGIYSIGFSLVMMGLTQPLSGKTAYIPVPDGLFPVELVTFGFFGALFIVAALYHFRAICHELSVDRTRFTRREV